MIINPERFISRASVRGRHPGILGVRAFAVAALAATMALLPGRMAAKSLTLVEAGAPRAVVVTADDPSPTAEYAAEELVHHFELATGAKLDAVAEANVPEGADPPHRIYVGESRAAEEAGIDVDELPLETAILRVIDDDLYVLGRENEEDPLSRANTHSGTLFGVYELFERTVSPRWLWPGELGTHVPQTGTVEVSAGLDKTVEPVFDPRHITLEGIHSGYFSSGEARDAYRHDLDVYLRRHRIGRSFTNPESPGHRLQGRLRAYARENPEGVPGFDDEGRGSLDVADPDLHRFIVEHHDKFDPAGRIWRETDERILIRLGDRDAGWQPSRSEASKAWDGPVREDGPINPVTGEIFEEGFYQRFGRMHTSDRYARFAKTIYEMARKRHPEKDVKVSTLLYWNNLFAPTTDIELNEDIFGYFVPWGTGLEGAVWFPISDTALEWVKQQWLGWRETGMSMVHRPNHLFAGYVMPHIERQGGEFFQWAHEHGMAGFYYTRLLGHWAAKGRNTYMYMRLFVHPEMEIDAIFDEYYSSFGPAAEHVRRYFEYWEAYALERHEPVELPPGLMFGDDYKLARHVTPLDPANLWNAVAGAADAFPVEKFASAKEILEKAMRAARQDADPVYAERVEFLQLGLEHARLASRFFETLDVKSAARAEIPEEPERRKAAVRAFEKLEAFRHRHGDDYIGNFGNALKRNEVGSIEPDPRKLRDEFSGDLE